MEGTAENVANVAYRANLHLYGHIRYNLQSETQRVALHSYHGNSPILTYSSMVWWPRVKNVSRIEISKIQRLACLAITGAMKKTLTAAIEVLLGLPPLHVMI